MNDDICLLLHANLLLSLLFDPEYGGDMFFHQSSRRYIPAGRKYLSHNFRTLGPKKLFLQRKKKRRFTQF
jgi:hypothetical protein